ncbi:hypothetical protein PIB30_090557 [Stylosanthes scabra]|uniref:Uncharacterized protein n=1 Tax=Stylosanthes scabra TaxID=79078 RepID=A0ABU6YT35_9FABA|nr:hypothetical protein [Stylosanthes scabra]
MLPTLGEQQSISPKQPGSSKSKDLNHANTTVNKNQGPQGELERAAMNISDSTKRDSTDKLQRMLYAIRIRKDTAQSTSVIQQRRSANFAQSEGNQGQVDNVQGDGSEMGKGRPNLKPTTIDEFLKENGIAVDLDGLSTSKTITKPHGDDAEDSMALYENYYQYVMAESEDEEASAEKWVIQTIRDAWKRFKGKLKLKHFEPYDNFADIVKNKPQRVPKDQFIKLLLYWSHPTIQAMCQRNKKIRNSRNFHIGWGLSISHECGHANRREQMRNHKGLKFLLQLAQAANGRNLTREHKLQLKSSRVGKVPVNQKRKFSGPYLGRNSQAGLGAMADPLHRVIYKGILKFLPSNSSTKRKSQL